MIDVNKFMQIITTTTLTISDANKSLIPFLVLKNGGLLDWETNEEAIIRLRNEISFMNALWQIAPHLLTYFWEANQNQVDSITQSLYNGAITTSTIIQDDES